MGGQRVGTANFSVPVVTGLKKMEMGVPALIRRQGGNLCLSELLANGRVCHQPHNLPLVMVQLSCTCMSRTK